MNESCVTPKIYLSGAIEHNSDGHNWWDNVTDLFKKEGVGVLNPAKGQIVLETMLAKYADDKCGCGYGDTIYQIVNKDLRMIAESCGSFVRYCEGVRRGAGTHGEITLHRALGLPVIVWTNGYNKQQIPGWVWGCASNVIDDKDIAVHALIDLININISSKKFMNTLAIQDLMKGFYYGA